MRWLTTLTLAPIASLGLSAPLAAYDLPADATEMETALYGVLEKHCSRCHQDGALKEGLAGAKSGFGHVLDLRRLAEDPDYVRPGDPGASKLYNVIGPYSFPSMPDDCLDDACYPTNDDAKIIEDWIVANPICRGPNWICAMDGMRRVIDSTTGSSIMCM